MKKLFKSLTTEEFIAKAILIHGYKYDYSLVNYIHSRIKVKIICKIHGEFEQKPETHLGGCGCRQCAKIKQNPFLTNEEFLEKANKIHFGKGYVYPDQYKGSEEKIKIICPIHGEFVQVAITHLSGHGCQKCARINGPKNQIKTTEYFIEKANEKHKGKGYQYPDPYINNKTKLRIICPKHGEFFQSPNGHLHGRGCPNCQTSNGELKIKNMLEENGVNFIPQHRFDDCKGRRVRLPFDFYLPTYNTIIEFDGRHHFQEIESWGHHRLEVTQTNDAIKTAYCKANNIPLIRIRYDEDIEQRVLELLKSLKVS